MASEEVLRKTIRNADGKPFQKYKGLQNSFVLENYEIIFDDIQNDRAGHTAMRVRVPHKKAGFPADTFDTKKREIALRDLIARRFREAARTYARSPIPKTSGGEVFIPRPGQEILERWSIVITQYCIEARFTADLPADGGKVSAAAMGILLERIDRIVSESLYFSAYKQSKVYNHLRTYENAEYIRENLDSKGIAAFIAEGAILPRRDDDLAPMVDAEPFKCSGDLRVTFDVPHGEPIAGAGIPKGFTVIAGPSRSGRTALMDAVYAGVYDHIPGDGREYVITSPDAAFIVSEPKRPADSVDISMFVKDSPDFEDTSAAKRDSVPSPMSELISISEAVEMGSRLILVDEEYSNPSVLRRGFLSDGESITPLADLGHSMGESDVSVLAVSGDESVIRSADNVLVMGRYALRRAEFERRETGAVFCRPADRFPVSKGIAYGKGRREVSTAAQEIRTVEIGELSIHVPVAALFDISQTSTVADAAAVMKDMMDGSKSMRAVCGLAIAALKENDDSPDIGSGMHHAQIRAIDLAAVLNRHPQMLAIQRRRSSSVVTVRETVEDGLRIIRHVHLIRLRSRVVVGNYESLDRVFLVAVWASHVGAVLVRLGTELACDGPGLEEAEFLSAVGAQIPACRHFEVVVDPCRSLLGCVPDELSGGDRRVVTGLIGVVWHVQFPFAADITELSTSRDAPLSSKVPVTMMSAPASLAAFAASGVVMPPPTMRGMSTLDLMALIIAGGTGLYAPEPASK